MKSRGRPACAFDLRGRRRPHPTSRPPPRAAVPARSPGALYQRWIAQGSASRSGPRLELTGAKASSHLRNGGDLRRRLGSRCSLGLMLAGDVAGLTEEKGTLPRAWPAQLIALPAAKGGPSTPRGVPYHVRSMAGPRSPLAPNVRSQVALIAIGSGGTVC
jgi:hypothetical protein